ncbi:helix-turn-helix domain-containing protein [Paenibacillus sp. Marseille-Q9583]
MYEKFLELLKKSGKTPYQVAKDTGVSTATLTNWKQGNYKPKTDKLKILADYFDVTVDFFLQVDETAVRK